MFELGVGAEPIQGANGLKISQSGSHLVSSSLELKEGFVNVGLTVLGRANGLAQELDAISNMMRGCKDS